MSDSDRPRDDDDVEQPRDERTLSPDEETLKAMQKGQNTRRSIDESVRRINSHGIAVNAGYIVGFAALAGLAATFLSPDEGTVSIDGIDLRTVNLASYRDQLGLVLQDDFLFDGTIRENLLFARPDATPDEQSGAQNARQDI